MSAIGNKLLSGYYKTPLEEGQFMKQLLQFNEQTTIFDPTCGEGEILAYLTEGMDHVQTFGVEIDKGRALKAKEVLDVCLYSPIESCVISNNFFGMVYLNPPYDHTMRGYGDDSTERKEYQELVRNTRYLRAGGVMVYTIPSYRFSDPKIARYLSTYFEDAVIARFADETYEDYSQCVFIARKKRSSHCVFSPKMFSVFEQMIEDDFIFSKLPTLAQVIEKGRTWVVPQTPLNPRTFYSRLETKDTFIPLINENRGFHAFKERTKPRDVRLNGQPILNISQGEMALLLASGMVNGIVGEGEHIHALQGIETVTMEQSTEASETGETHISRTKRSVSIKVITPNGVIKKLS